MKVGILLSERLSLALLVGVGASLILFIGLTLESHYTPVEAQTVDTPTTEATGTQGEETAVERLPLIEGKLNPPKYPKLDSNLNRIIQQVESGQTTARAAAVNAPIHREESVAVTLYIANGHVNAMVEFLESNGADARNIDADYIEAYVPISLLPGASMREGVASIRTIIPPQPDQSTLASEAASVHGARAWHEAGIRGKGVKIGIIDLVFEDFRIHMGSELPDSASVRARCYTDLGIPTENLSDCENADPDNEDAARHGTAVTEAAFDIAPEATYYVSDPQSLGDLKTAVEWMIEQDVDVINMSLSWLWDGPGNGTSPFDGPSEHPHDTSDDTGPPYSDSPLRTVDLAVQSGITWVNSAGNRAQGTWFGSFSDTERNDWHQFSADTDDECIYIYGELETGNVVVAQLRWDDSWGSASTDLDLYLALSDGRGLTDVDWSTDYQSETGIPFEYVQYEVQLAGHYCLRVSRYSGEAPSWIQLQVWMPHPYLEGHTPGHSITNPGESSNPGLLAVGAADVGNLSEIEDFSSRGPAPDGRPKPDIVGADKVYSTAYGRDFPGTSQASPHVAGLAALVKQRFLDYGPQEVAQYLRRQAQDKGAPGRDNEWGYGLARLTASDAVLPTPEPPLQGTCLSSAAVPESDANPGLVADCDTLLAVKSTLAGTAGLNWSSAIAIEDWDGVAVSGTPLRVTELILHTRGLTGTIPVELANLKELTRLNLSHNSLTSGIPSELPNLSDLSVLYLAVNRLEGGIPTELGSLSNLTALWLSENQLTGEIPPSLGDLHNLRLLYLWHNQLSGEIPPEFGNLSELRSLVLHENHLTGEIPAELGNLSFLEVLHLKNNQLIGCIPDSLGDVRDNDLDELGLPLCGEVEDPTPSPVPTPTQACIESLPGSGVFTGFWTDDCVSLHPDRQGSYARFYTLDLPEDSDLVVTLESSVDTYLYLRAGDGRDGEILDSDDDDDNNDFSLNSGTDSGMRLTSLEAGDYTIEATTYSAGEGGQFTLTVQGLSTVATPAPTPTVAPVTPTPQPVTSRKVLSIGSGHICSLDANGIIDCWGSDDHGQTTLPPSIAGTAFSAVSSGANHTCALTNLGSIACWGANDHGQTTLPASLAGTRFSAVSSGVNHTCALADHGSVDCWGANDHGQSTPPTGGTFVAITSAYDSSCALRSDNTHVCWGAVPFNLAPPEAVPTPTPTQTPITTPVPSPTPIHSSETDRDALVAFYDATGGPNWTVNSNWASGSSLSQWHGVRTDTEGRVTALILENNGLTGSLPQEMGALTQLQELRLGLNELTGAIPIQLSNLSNLHALVLSDSNLTGTIPPGLGDLNNLRVLDLGHNELTGTIPAQLGDLRLLTKLALGDNQLVGDIPVGLAGSSHLETLILASNQLIGGIPVELGNLIDLRDLKLSGNFLTGQVPSEVGNLTKLENLWLQRNQLTGELPQTLTALSGLKTLFFEDNGGLCAPVSLDFQNWTQTVEEVSGPNCEADAGNERAKFEGGIDLGIAYIERVPRHQRYKLTYLDRGPCPYPFEEFIGPVLCPGEESLKRWPDPGENIKLRARVWNFGDTPSGPFNYVWSVSGSTVASGLHPGLEPNSHTGISLPMEWPDAEDNPKVTLALDPDNTVDELLEYNNLLDDWVRGYTIGFYFSHVSYESLTLPNTPGQTVHSPEHWVHQNIARLNEMLIDAGLEDRVRSEIFEITDDRALWSNHPLQWYMDGWWPVWDNLPDPSVFDLQGYKDRPEIEYGLLHELLHQLGAIDLYQMHTDSHRVLLPDANRPGFQAGCGTDYWNRDYECFRFTGIVSDIMDGGGHFIGSHTAGGLRSNSGHRRGFYGEYLYDTPRTTFLRVTDENGDPISHLTLRFYQLGVPEAGHIIDATAEFVLETNEAGVAELPNRGITGIVTETGHQLTPNPFGWIHLAGFNGMFLIEMVNADCTNYEWLTVVDLNLAFWNGQTEEVTFDKTHRCPPVYRERESENAHSGILPGFAGMENTPPLVNIPHSAWPLLPGPDSSPVERLK